MQTAAKWFASEKFSALARVALANKGFTFTDESLRNIEREVNGARGQAQHLAAGAVKLGNSKLDKATDSIVDSETHRHEFIAENTGAGQFQLFCDWYSSAEKATGTANKRSADRGLTVALPDFVLGGKLLAFISKHALPVEFKGETGGTQLSTVATVQPVSVGKVSKVSKVSVAK